MPVGCSRVSVVEGEAAVARLALLRVWQSSWRERGFRLELVGSVGLLAGVGLLFSRFGVWIEQRAGTVLRDPVLEHLPAIDLTWFTFAVMYVALGTALFGMLHAPHRLLFWCRFYAAVMLTRLVAMYLTELDDPLTSIPLQDPVSRIFFHTQTIPTKDLFFSGHTATMFSLYLTASTPRRRALYLAATLVIGAAVLLQRVHYTIDVLAAPFFTYGVHRLLQMCAGERPSALPEK
jgi:hypothetical protein